jgi:hypothetical protein
MDQRAASLIYELNDSQFHRFWYTLIGHRKLVLVYAVPVYRPIKEWNWPTDKDREGIALLRRAFSTHFKQDPIEEFSCGTPNVETFLERSDIFLSGGAVSNTLTRSYFNHFRGLRYVIDYEMPNYSNISIMDRCGSRRLHAEYKNDVVGGRSPTRDLGILTVMRSPIAPRYVVLGAMGIHGYGSLGCFKALTDPVHLRALMQAGNMQMDRAGYQVLIEHNLVTDESRILLETLHVIEGHGAK